MSEKNHPFPVKNPSTKPQKPVYSTTSSILDVSAFILSALTSAAQCSQFPSIQQASALALTILTTIRNAADNKQSFNRLATDACELVAMVVCMYEDTKSQGQEMSESLVRDLQDLVNTLQEIESFSQAHATRNALQRIVSRTSDTLRIQEYRERLRQALDVFGLQSNISIRETVTRMAERQATFHEELRQRDLKDREEREQRRSTLQDDSSSTVGSPVDSESPPTPVSARLEQFSRFPPSTQVTVIGGDFTQSGNMYYNGHSNGGNTTTTTTVNSYNKYAVVRDVDFTSYNPWRKHPSTAFDEIYG